MNTDEIISGLKKYGDFHKVQQKISFQCLRNDKNCNEQEVQVDILDAGSDVYKNRYHCRATTKDGKVATGNPESSIKLVLMGVHWENLD